MLWAIHARLWAIHARLWAIHARRLPEVRFAPTRRPLLSYNAFGPETRTG